MMNSIDDPDTSENRDENDEENNKSKIHNSGEFGITPSFSVEISGALLNDVPVKKGLIGSLVQAISLITVRPLQSVIISFIESRAEIQIMDDRAKIIARVEKFKNIAEVYNQAMRNAEQIRLDKPEMKEAYLKALSNDLTQQFKNLLDKKDL